MQTDSARLIEAQDVVHELIGAPAEIERLVGGGRNSRIYHVQSGSKEFALKQYPSRADDPRDRLSTEVGALHLMERYGIDTVPRVAGVDRERGFALLSWIDGAAVTEIADADIDAAADFLSAIHALRTYTLGEGAACRGGGLSVWRRNRAADREPSGSGFRTLRDEGALASFLKNDFIPVSRKRVQ